MAGIPHVRFENCRSSIIYACLAADRPCLLAAPEWTTVPWSLDPDQKSLHQRLLDILVDLPQLLRAPTKLWSTKDPPPELFGEVIKTNKELKAKITQLEEWWSVWCEEHPHSYWEVAANFVGLDPDCTPTAWSTEYEFQDLLTAHEFSVFQATKALIIGTSRAIDSLEPNVHSAHLASMAKQARRAALEICRSISYHLRPEHRSGGTILSLFPYRIAWRAYGDTSTNEGRWLQHIVEGVSTGMSGEWSGASGLVRGYYESPKEPKQFDTE